jgi:phospho-N-acetylmuramoyl-pentapeptide-transferase
MNPYQEIITYIIASAILSGLLAIPIIAMLYRLKVVRKIDVDFSTVIEERKGKYGIPIMGGIIFIISILLINYLFNFNRLTSVPLHIFFATALLGAIDDLLNIFGRQRKIRGLRRSFKLIRVHKSFLIRLKYFLLLPWTAFTAFMHMFESNPGSGLRANEKLFIQILLGIIFGFWVKNVIGAGFWIPFLGTYNIGDWMIPFAAFSFVAMTNAVNITDGMDGLAGGIALIILAAIIPLLVTSNQPLEYMIFIGSSAGALLIYLYFNIPPARIQMGDTGSFALGALLTIIFFMIGKPLLLLVFGLPYIIELLSIIVQSISRRIFGRRLLQMAPLHHHFEMIGWREDKVVIRSWILSIMCCLIGIWISFF